MGLRLKEAPYFWNAHGHIRWKCYRKWFILDYKHNLQKKCGKKVIRYDV